MMSEKKNGGLVVMKIVMSLLLWMSTLQLTASITLKFNVETATKEQYSAVLENMRNTVKGKNLHYGGLTQVPVIAAPTNPPKYFYVDLVSGKKTITIGLNMNNLYMEGYLENLKSTIPNGEDRGYYFKEAPKNAQTQLFPNIKPIELTYSGSYPSIEGKTKTLRSKVPLARSTLKSRFDEIYGVNLDPKKQADLTKQGKFLLTIIQMFSEAARSKYIETMVADNFYKTNGDFYYTDPKALSLQNEWGKISKGIKFSVNGVINPPLTDVKDVRGNKRTISKVSDIKNDMGILNYVPDKRLYLYSEMLMSPSSLLGNNDSSGGIHGASG